MSIPQRPQRIELEGPTTRCIIDGKALGWTNASAALDSVRLYGGSGNLDTGSTLTVYGRG